MKRRFFWFVVALLIGIVLTAKGQYSILLTSVIVSALGSVFTIYSRFSDLGKLSFALLCGILLGVFLFLVQFSAYERKVETLLGDDPVFITGRVEEVSKTAKGKTRLLLQEKTGKRLRFYIYLEADKAFSVGDMIELTAPVSVAGRPANFGETDYRFYYMSQGVHGSVFCEKDEIIRTGRDFHLYRPLDFIHAIKSRMTNTIEENMPRDVQGFLLALLTGDTSAIYLDASADLRAAGLSHTVAVSGMHLQGIIQAFMMLFGAMQLRRHKGAGIICLFVAWFFVVFTGASPSVLRAAIMLSVCFGALFLQKQNDGLTALAFSAFLLSLHNAATIFDISFQLSAASTLTILLYARKIEARIYYLPKFLRQSFSLSMAASIGFVLPSAYQFGTVSTVGIVANVFVCPVLTPLLVGGYFSILFAKVPVLGPLFFSVLTYLIRYVLAVANFFGRAPMSQVLLPKPTWIHSCIYFLFAKAYFALLSHRRRQCICFVNTALLLLLLTLVKTYFGSAEVTFLNVGNSDCALVSSNGNYFLFDGGGSIYSDVGEKTVLPYLQRRGIGKIDMAFLTHYHVDHTDGLITLLERGYIGHLFLPYHADIVEKYKLTEAAKKSGTPITILKGGEIIKAGNLEVAAFDTAAQDAENNGLLYRLSIWGTRVLFTGDVSERGEMRLISAGADIESAVLKVPHHGSNTSSGEAFLSAVHPSLAVVTCGENNYNHPHPDVLARYNERGIPLLRSDENGTISIQIFQNGTHRIKTQYKNNTLLYVQMKDAILRFFKNWWYYEKMIELNMKNT